MTTQNLRLEHLSARYRSLSAESDAVAQLAVGVNALLDELRAAPQSLAAHRQAAVADALSALLDALAAEPPALTVPQQFVEAFRAEARKRLAGLSLSLTGAFSSEPDSLEQSIQHLHAIRGGAAMLQLLQIADLAGVMEDVVLAGRRGALVWPVRPMLRGFAMLQAAIDDPESDDNALLRDVTDELHGHLAALTQPDFDDTPITNINLEPLQQRILVVDDVETIAHSVGLILSELDIPIDVAHDGAEALDLLRAQPYSLVLSDVAMPHLDGLDLTRAIRADDALSDLPVILLTALNRADERAAGLQAGANDYIVKGSIGGGELLSRVHELLKTAPVVPSTPDTRRFRRILVVEDIETIAASIAFVLSDGPYEIQLAHDGADALDTLRTTLFDLVITDLDMPNMNGIDLTAAIRANDALCDIPVVMLTARNTDEHRKRALDAGVSKFLVKGEVASGKLLDEVRNLLHSQD